MPQTRLGELTIDRVVEFEQPEFDIYEFFPDATPELLAPHLDWLVPRLPTSRTSSGGRGNIGGIVGNLLRGS